MPARSAPTRSPCKAVLSLVAIAVASSIGWAQEHRDLPPSNAVSPEIVATGLERAAGVAVDHHGNVFAPNYRNLGELGRITPDGSASVFCRLDELAPVDGRRSYPHGVRRITESRLVIADAGGGRLLRIDKDGKRAEILADRHNGARFRQVAHVAPSTAGDVYFTERPVQEDDEGPRGQVLAYRVRTQKTELLIEGLDQPTGIAVSPAQDKLCVAEAGPQRILVYDLDAGKPTRRRELIRFPTQTQGAFVGGDFRPRGMAFDQKGRLYVAMEKGKLINVVDLATGQLLRQYNVDGVATDCHFHSAVLFVAIESKEAIVRLNLGVEGFRYTPAPVTNSPPEP